MDNITHSLMGLVLAECGRTLLPRKAGEALPAWLPWSVSVLANNLPDMDILWAHALGGKLGYMLHHRGHTHTFPGALLMGALALGGALLLSRSRRNGSRGVGRSSLVLLLVLAIAGPFVHLWMDSWNFYGVHPAWPLDPRWYFGDAVFILEPWLWVALMPPLLVRPEMQRRGRWILLTLFLLLLGLGAATSMVPAGLLALLTASFLAAWATTSRHPRSTPWVGLGLVLAFVAGTHLASGSIARMVRIETGRPEAEVQLSPMPANPGCWTVLTLEADEDADLYRIARGFWSWTPGGGCPPRAPTGTTAPLLPADPPRSHLSWEGSFRAPLSELRRLEREHCYFRAFLHFSRAPFWLQEPGGAWIYGDLRFDRSPGLGFSEIRDPEGPEADCEGLWVPDWTPPLAPHLGPSSPSR